MPNLSPSGTLAYTDYLYAQTFDTSIIPGWNISCAAEHTSIVTDSEFSVGTKPGLPGTKMSVSAIPKIGGGIGIITFFQTEGNDITEFMHDLVDMAAPWSTVDIPIPNT